jgi:VIT1/CCC1 family predicted Fe2+/Mn2+ transporter
VAESISMAAVAYTTSVAENDVYRAEQEREYRHVRAVPALEREEIRALYARKGFSGELLDRIVAGITADPDVWVAVMMSEEHRLAPVSRGRSLRATLVVLLASLVGSLLPIVPFFFLPVALGMWVAAAVAAAALFAIGMHKARTTIGRPLWAGVEIAAIGMASALAGWAVGSLFQGHAAP